ncbi:hypothetical protein B7463_g12596, partial [Scytalidium lignicola]
MSLKSLTTLLLASISTLVSASPPPSAYQSPTTPSVEGPTSPGTRPNAFSSFLGNLTQIGYIEEEFFYSGNATRYNLVGGEVTLDGKFSLTVNSTAAYKTRILIRRPANPKNFNGDAILEWNNVSDGFDLVISDHPGVYQAGYIFAGVTAQKVGVDGEGDNPLGLRQWDSERYGSLSIADDALSYDIYTQAANAVRHNAGNMIGGYKVEHIFATGESQSGTRMLAYADGVQPISNAFDAILPVIAFGMAADFDPAQANPVIGQAARAFPARIRDDLKIPVFEVNSESETLNVTWGDAEQPDTDRFRYWETAGAAHLNTGVFADTEGFAARDGLPPLSLSNLSLSQVDWRVPLEAAYRHTSLWVRTGKAPPSFPKLERGHNGSFLVRDADGNSIGGVRLPEITVPIAAYSGLSLNSLGSTTPFSDARLKQLYPTHEDYVAKITAAAKKAECEGIILSYKVPEYIMDAVAANIPPK